MSGRYEYLRVLIPSMKPCIKFVRVNGVSPLWKCMGQGGYCYGNTPQQAYQNWAYSFGDHRT